MHVNTPTTALHVLRQATEKSIVFTCSLATRPDMLNPDAVPLAPEPPLRTAIAALCSKDPGAGFSPSEARWLYLDVSTERSMTRYNAFANLSYFLIFIARASHKQWAAAVIRRPPSTLTTCA